MQSMEPLLRIDMNRSERSHTLSEQRVVAARIDTEIDFLDNSAYGAMHFYICDHAA